MNDIKNKIKNKDNNIKKYEEQILNIKSKIKILKEEKENLVKELNTKENEKLSKEIRNLFKEKTVDEILEYIKNKNKEEKENIIDK